MEKQAHPIRPTDFADPSDHPALPAMAYLSRLGSTVSRNGMVSALNSISEVLTGTRDWRGTDWTHILQHAGRVENAISRLRGAPATKNKAIAAVKGMARASYRMGFLSAEQVARVRGIAGYRYSRNPVGRDVPANEVAALLEACANDRSPSGLRDRALLAVAITTGARRAELASIRVCDLSDNDGLIRVRIIGKGDKERFLYIHGAARDSLEKWIEARGRTPGALFSRISKSGKIGTAHITTAAMAKILIKRIRQAGLTEITFHDFRRTAAGNLLDAGADLATVAGILGHSSPVTTARYDRRGERARMAASRLLTLP